MWSPMPSSSIKPTVVHSPALLRILSEHLVPVPEPLAVALRPAGEAAPHAVLALAARALLDRPALAPAAWPAWLAPHQVPAAERLSAILARHGGALLADAVGLGKSYVALAVALARGEPFVLVVPAVLVPQWRALLDRFAVEAPIVTHESLSGRDGPVGARHAVPLQPDRPSGRPPVRLFVIDEAHRFRNPDTRRYRALARLVVGAQVLLVTATPVHNRLGDLFHLFQLFLRDDALAALGVPSLRRAARGGGEIEPALAAAAAARLVVARSRTRVREGYGGGPIALAFPRRSGETLRVGPAPDAVLEALVAGVRRLTAGGRAAPLLRLILLRRLASSLPAFRASLLRQEAYADLATRAAAEGRDLSARDFQRCFPPTEDPDVQLALFPLLLDAAGCVSPPDPRDRRELARLRALATEARDPKADALERLLDARPAKTIVFTDAQRTVRHLLQRLRRRRVGAVFGAAGRFAAGEASRHEVLRAFAPVAQHASSPAAALETDVLIATDLVSEGLNLQDAERVVHYDLPWSPARLAQRVGRIDRLGSPHAGVATVAFLPPEPLAAALALEERLAAKTAAQAAAGAAQMETTVGPAAGAPGLDWCDRLAQLAGRADDCPPAGAVAAVRGKQPATVLVVRIGRLVEAIVVHGDAARADPVAATELLAAAHVAEPASLDRAALHRAVEIAAPLVRARLATMQDARWRATDRDRLARRLIPWALSAARRAARRADAAQLAKLDGLVSRLALGMTAGEALLLDDLLSRREPLAVRDLLAWHERLPDVREEDAGIAVELVAALLVVPPAVTLSPCPSPLSSSTSTAPSSTRST
jgi:superfamily II DNA or RNA helicase